MTTNEQLPTTTTSTTAQPRRRGRMIATGIGATLAGGAIAAGLILGLGGSAASASGNDNGSSTPATHTSYVVIHDGSSTPKPAPKPQPSPSVETLQQELAQLNYYNGPIDGFDGPATQAAITYLQRDAGLPQTGHMDQATSAALMNYLKNGNNQMAG